MLVAVEGMHGNYEGRITKDKGRDEGAKSQSEIVGAPLLTPPCSILDPHSSRRQPPASLPADRHGYLLPGSQQQVFVIDLGPHADLTVDGVDLGADKHHGAGEFGARLASDIRH